MELYQIRWSIEVLFKESKQYLRLGKSQNTDFCGQIADASLTMITYDNNKYELSGLECFFDMLNGGREKRLKF